MSCRVVEQKSTLTARCQAGGKRAFTPRCCPLLDTTFHWRTFSAVPSTYCAFAVHDLQFYEDGREIARYVNTLPGPCSCRRRLSDEWASSRSPLCAAAV